MDSLLATGTGIAGRGVMPFLDAHGRRALRACGRAWRAEPVPGGALQVTVALDRPAPAHLRAADGPPWALGAARRLVLLLDGVRLAAAEPALDLLAALFPAAETVLLCGAPWGCAGGLAAGVARRWPGLRALERGDTRHGRAASPRGARGAAPLPPGCVPPGLRAVALRGPCGPCGPFGAAVVGVDHLAALDHLLLPDRATPDPAVVPAVRCLDVRVDPHDDPGGGWRPAVDLLVLRVALPPRAVPAGLGANARRVAVVGPAATPELAWAAAGGAERIVALRVGLWTTGDASWFAERHGALRALRELRLDVWCDGPAPADAARLAAALGTVRLPSVERLVLDGGLCTPAVRHAALRTCPNAVRLTVRCVFGAEDARVVAADLPGVWDLKVAGPPADGEPPGLLVPRSVRRLRGLPGVAPAGGDPPGAGVRALGGWPPGLEELWGAAVATTGHARHLAGAPPRLRATVRRVRLGPGVSPPAARALLAALPALERVGLDPGPPTRRPARVAAWLAAQPGIPPRLS